MRVAIFYLKLIGAIKFIKLIIISLSSRAQLHKSLTKIHTTLSISLLKQRARLDLTYSFFVVDCNFGSKLLLVTFGCL